VRWAGTNGVFWRSFQRMAIELGKSARQVKRDMAELEKRGLIQHERRGHLSTRLPRLRRTQSFRVLAFLVNLMMIDPVARPAQDLGELVVGQQTPKSTEWRSCREMPSNPGPLQIPAQSRFTQIPLIAHCP